MTPGRVVALTVASLAAAAAPGLALDPRKAISQYSHRVWQIEEGLPEVAVQTVVQTRDGYLWLGTQEGLARFDGVRFTVFDRATTPALRQNFIQALHETRDGSLWIGTGGGGLTRLHQGTFTAYTLAEGLASNVVDALHEDRQGTLWIGTSGGLSRFRGGRFETLTSKDGLSSDRVLALAEDREGTLWIGTDGGGLDAYRDGRFRALTTKDGLPSDVVYAIEEGRGGDLWVGTLHGLAHLRDGRFTTYTTKDGLAGDRTDAILEDRDGSLWVGGDGSGVARLRDGRFTAFTTREGLSSDLVKSLYEDREGSLWIGTRGGGVNRLGDGKVTTFTTREGLAADVVWGTYEDREGSLWIATDGGGLSRLRDGRFVTYTKKDGLSVNNVRSLVEDHEGSLWVGTWGGGLNRFKDGRFTTWTTKDGLSHDIVRTVYEDREGNLWLGTYGGGLNRFKDGRFTVYTTKDGLGSDIVYCTIQGRDGDLWIGTRGGGLSRLHDGAFRTYTTKDGLSDDIVLSLYEDAQGSLWIGTRGGINRLKDGRFTHVSIKEGLFDDVAYQILEDGAGNLWMSSNKGIYRMARRDYEDVVAGRAPSLSSLSFGKADGMKDGECSGGVQPAGWKTRDGRLWFPTIHGVAMIDPSHFRTNDRPPPVVIEQVTIDGKRYDPRVGASVAVGSGELHFVYAGLAFLAPEKVRFKRKLEGFDPDWVDAGERREAHYTNIPPGAYTFRVIACNEDGLWNETGSSVRVELRPHFHQTAGFRALSLAGLALAGWGFYNLRVQQLRTREQELVSLVDERSRELLQVALELEEANHGLREAIRLKDEVVSIVAHDFRSPLTVVQGYSEMLQARAWDQESGRMLGIIHGQSRHLAGLAADTLTMSRIEMGNLPLDFGPVQMTELVRALVEGRAAETGTAVDFDAPDGEVVARGDRDQLQHVVDNLIGNAVKRSPSGARVRVVVRRNAEGAEVSVSDAGAGIPQEQMLRLFEKLSREGASRGGVEGTGLGLYVCRSIVEAHGGRIWVESTPGEGATFHVVLPAGDPSEGGMTS